MPIKQSAIKALRQSEKKASRNRARKRIIHDKVKLLDELIQDGKKADALKLLPEVYKAFDKAGKRGVLKQNTVSRRKSRLTKAVNALK